MFYFLNWTAISLKVETLTFITITFLSPKKTSYDAYTQMHILDNSCLLLEMLTDVSIGKKSIWSS